MSVVDFSSGADAALPSIRNGFYQGPILASDGSLEPIITYFDKLLGQDRVRAIGSADDGSLKLAIDFNLDRELTTEVAFIRTPDDWGGYDHHIIASTQYGCPHTCGMCVDGLPNSFKAHMSPEQMAYAAYRVLQEAEKIRGIDPTAKFIIMQLGSGDPGANGMNAGAFIRNVHKVDQRIKGVYTSTAGALGKNNMPHIVAAAIEAKSKGVIVEAQFSVHTLDPEKRHQLISLPATPLDKIREAAWSYAAKTRNNAYINYMVVPGWNNSLEDARALAKYVPENCILKLVRLNPTDDLFQLPQFLQVECTDKDVGRFSDLVMTAFMAAQNHSLIITPKDNAALVEAACGTVGRGALKGRSQLQLIKGFEPN